MLIGYPSERSHRERQRVRGWRTGMLGLPTKIVLTRSQAMLDFLSRLALQDFNEMKVGLLTWPPIMPFFGSSFNLQANAIRRQVDTSR